MNFNNCYTQCYEYKKLSKDFKINCISHHSDDFDFGKSDFLFKS